MEAEKDKPDPASSAEPGNPGRSTLQSIEDFEKEQEDLERSRASESNGHLAATPAKNQKTTSLQAERENLESGRVAQKGNIKAEREKLEAERLARKAALQAERKQLEAEKKEKKAILQAERHLLEEEKLAVEKRAFEAMEELGIVNWIGQLLEYRNAHRTATGGLSYAEEVVPAIGQPRFTYRVVISETDQHFGAGISFSNKKDAKRYAAKKAIDWLIENDYMPANGSVRVPTPSSPPVVVKTTLPVHPVTLAAPSPSGKPKASPKTRYSGQVPDLCLRLGFNTPTYEITKHSENTPLWSGYAHFGEEPLIEGKVGEVKSVYGKSNAKEQIAMGVLSFLRDIERQRMEMEMDDEDDGDRKRKRESPNADIGESAGKAVRIED